MSKAVKLFFIMILSILTANLVTPACYANSAEPPSILIIVPNAPDDLEIGIRSDTAYIKARKTDSIIESYYTFYLYELKTAKDYTIKISTEGSSFEMLLEPLKSYNNIYTLNLKNKTLTPGKLLPRSILLVSLRLTLTILIEAIIFWLFGFRKRKSWIAFLIINLITQGALNIWLNGIAPLQSYIIISLIFGEILVFIAEITAFLAFVREHHFTRRLLFAVLANLLSLFAGGYIITVLPV